MKNPTIGYWRVLAFAGWMGCSAAVEGQDALTDALRSRMAELDHGAGPTLAPSLPPEVERRLVEALRTRMAELEAGRATGAMAASPSAPALPPAPVPPPPDTPEGRLKELTRQYQNGQISPRAYHAQRAKWVGSAP